MDRQRNARANPSLQEFCAQASHVVTSVPGSYASFNKRGRNLPASSVPFSSWTSYKMKHRRSHYAHRTGRHRFSGCSWAPSDTRLHYPRRQFSEDSGFSSCGSSASSIADDSEVTGGPVLSIPKASFWSLAKNKVSTAAHSGIVASVLAAGISFDCEETDQIESDEEGANCMPHSQVGINLNSQANVLNKFKYLSMDVPPSSYPENLQLMHSGRNILDLGANLKTEFPLQASKLPERNLPVYLLNRSQYHRLGKFGTSETLLYANCKNICDFIYPVPPNGDDFSNHRTDQSCH